MPFVKLSFRVRPLLCAVFVASCSWAGSVFDMPGLQDRFMAIKQELMNAVQARNASAMEDACRAGRALLPEDPVFAYNLACALAMQGRRDEALTALRESITLGFGDIELIRKDDDLAMIRHHPAFETILKQAERPQADDAQLRMNAAIPTVIRVGAGAMVSATNTMWDFDNSMFRTVFTLQESEPDYSQYSGPAATLLKPWLLERTAAGNIGDLYDNRDEGHSRLDYEKFPGLTPVVYGREVRQAQTRPYYGAAMFIYNLPTLGNSSTALTAGPFWRSQARMLSVTPARASGLFSQYFANQIYFYPAHKDYDTTNGDVFPFNAPYYVVSVGSSGSDKPFMNAVAATLAAFTPETKRVLVGSRLLAPTVQMILRSTQKTVKSAEDYYSGVAHPVAFAASNLNVNAMVKMAHEVTSNNIPPLVTLQVVRETQLQVGRDFFDGFAAAGLYDSPALLTRVFRGTAWQHTMTVRASGVVLPGVTNLTWRWALLQGDEKLVNIRPLGTGGQMAEISVAYHVPQFPGAANSEIKSSRVDIGVFAHNGTYPSAPAMISFYFLANEQREYDSDNRIVSVEYGGAGSGYVDPMLSYRRQWRDVYKYDAKGRVCGWQRSRGSIEDSFTAHGMLVETWDELGRARTARAVRYLPRSAGEPGSLPDLVQVGDNKTFTYTYLGDDDFIGHPVADNR